MVRLVTILSWSLLARSYWSPVNKPCCLKLSHWHHLNTGVCDTFSGELHCNSPFQLSNPFFVPLHRLFFFSCHHRGRGVCYSLSHIKSITPTHRIPQKYRKQQTCVVFVDPQCPWNIFKSLFVVVFNNFPAVLVFTSVHFGWHYTDAAVALFSLVTEN